MKAIALLPATVLAIAGGWVAAAEPAKTADASHSARGHDPAAPQGRLEIRPTYGPGGGTRPASVIAGDALSFAVTVSDVGITPTGKFDFVLTGDLVDPEGKVLERIAPRQVDFHGWLGGTSVVQYFTHPIARDLPPGVYQIRIRARDSEWKERASQTLAVTVLPNGTFGATNLWLYHDRNRNTSAGGVFAVGVDITAAFNVVGFDTTGDRVWIESRISVLDEAGKRVSPDPMVITCDKPLPTPADRASAARGAGHIVTMGLNRPGKFRLHIELEDHIGKHTAVVEVPIIVVSP